MIEDKEYLTICLRYERLLNKRDFRIAEKWPDLVTTDFKFWNNFAVTVSQADVIRIPATFEYFVNFVHA